MNIQQLEQAEEERENIKSGIITGIRYNQIALKEDGTGRGRVIYFEGLQKRVLGDYGEDILSRIKRIEFTDKEEFWDIGINLFVCCDGKRCKNALFSLIDDDDDFNDKTICADCDGWFCSSCIEQSKGGLWLCKHCRALRTAREI